GMVGPKGLFPQLEAAPRVRLGDRVAALGVRQTGEVVVDDGDPRIARPQRRLGDREGPAIDLPALGEVAPVLAEDPQIVEQCDDPAMGRAEPRFRYGAARV